MCSVFLPCPIAFLMFWRQTLSNMKCLMLAICPPHLIPINKITLPALSAHIYEATFEIEHNGTPIAFYSVCVLTHVCVRVCVCVLHSDSLKTGFRRNRPEIEQTSWTANAHIFLLWNPPLHWLATVPNGACLVRKHLKEETEWKILKPTTGWIGTVIRD